VKTGVGNYAAYDQQKLFAIVLFEMSPNVNTLERRVVTIVDAIQKVGGLFGALSTLFLLISLKIQKVLYVLELVRRTLHETDVPSQMNGESEINDFPEMVMQHN